MERLNRVNSPSVEYKQRQEARLRTRAERERVHIRIGNYKLVVIVAFFTVAGLAFWKQAISGYWLIVPVVAYAALAVWHEFAIRARRHAEIAAAFYERGLARIEDRWSGTGETGERFRDPKHVYVEDIDIFGNGGLFQLLSGARTPMGESCLARWLAEPSPVATLRERHALIRELREKVDLREDLALIGEDMRPRLEPEKLAPWAEKDAVLPKSGVRALAIGLAILAVLAIILWFINGDFWPLLVMLLINGAIYGWLRKRAEAAVSGMDCNAEGVALFSQILARIERETFTSERLLRLQAQLKSEQKAGVVCHCAPGAAHLLDRRSRQLWHETNEGAAALFGATRVRIRGMATAMGPARARLDRRRGRDRGAAVARGLFLRACG